MGENLRCEKEMMDTILGIARNDDRIRAVYMNGSRTNPNIPKDKFQDYDIVYVVDETGSFIKDKHWVKQFGDLLMIQEPYLNNQRTGMKVDFDQTYAYLMLFTDGNRIDLTLQTKNEMLSSYTDDKLTVPLLDKDDCLPTIPAPSDEDYHVKKPTEGLYFARCNNFWWCLQNVVKGMWRDELPYAKQMYELTTRVCLNDMVS